MIFYGTAGLVLAAGIVMRITGAWWLGQCSDDDHGMASLTARHMAEGSAFPVLFENTPALGTFEAAAGAVFCRLLGVSSWAVNLGTAALSALLLPVLFAWGRAAGGPRAGIAAAGFAAVGPPMFYRYSCCSYGGYAAMMLCALTTLWLTTYIADHVRARRRFSRWLFLCLGLVAGIGWWTTPLVGGCYAAAGIIWIVALGRRALSWRLIYVLLGFTCTSAPRWWPHVMQQDAAPAVTGFSLDAAPYAHVAAQLPGLLGFWREQPARMAGMATLAVMTVLALTVMVRRWRGLGNKGHALYILAALLGALSHLLLLTSADLPPMAAERHLLLTVPLIAVLVGVATAGLARHLAWGVGWLPLVFLVSAHLAWLPGYPRQHTKDQAFARRARTLQSELGAEGIEGVYASSNGPYGQCGLNFMAGESIAFSDPLSDGHGPSLARMDALSSIAVLDNYGSIADLLQATGGRARVREVASFILYDRFVPPPRQDELAPAQWSRVTVGDTTVGRTVLSDGRLSTVIPAPANGAGQTITFDFTNEVSLSGFRLRMEGAPIALSWNVQVPDGGNGWRDVTDTCRATSYFWSGPRPYCGEPYYRTEAQFEAVNTPRIRLRLWPAPTAPLGAVSELQWLTPAEPEEHAPADDVDALLEVLRQREIQSVYADRWLAARLAALSEGRMATNAGPSAAPGGPATGSSVMALQARSGIVVPREHARLCREVLGREDVRMRETRVGPWILFDMVPGTWSLRYETCDGLRWAGYACLAE